MALTKLISRLHTCPRVPALLSAMSTSMSLSTSMPASNSASTSPQLRSLADWSFGEPKLADLPLDRLVIVHSFGRRGSNLFCIFSLICFQRWKNHSEQRTAGHFLLGHPHTMEGLLSTVSDLRFSTIVKYCSHRLCW